MPKQAVGFLFKLPLDRCRSLVVKVPPWESLLDLFHCRTIEQGVEIDPVRPKAVVPSDVEVRTERHELRGRGRVARRPVRCVEHYALYDVAHPLRVEGRRDGVQVLVYTAFPPPVDARVSTLSDVSTCGDLRLRSATSVYVMIYATYTVGGMVAWLVIFDS
ncbi:hypothetical protein B0H14DRAFT_138135 [Mycena olivaceomarginata]|nr:hypothetical protein B0H14DRAFT_138135 [Mycena olivaceomarginata]